MDRRWGEFFYERVNTHNNELVWNWKQSISPTNQQINLCFRCPHYVSNWPLITVTRARTQPTCHMQLYRCVGRQYQYVTTLRSTSFGCIHESRDSTSFAVEDRGLISVAKFNTMTTNENEVDLPKDEWKKMAESKRSSFCEWCGIEASDIKCPS